MPSTRSKEYSVIEPPSRNRGPLQRVTHDFEVKQIESAPILIKDVLGHIVFERTRLEREGQAKERKRSVSNNIAIYLRDMFNGGEILSEQRLADKIDEVWEKYGRLTHKRVQNQDRRRAWYEQTFSHRPLSQAPRQFSPSTERSSSPIAEAFSSMVSSTSNITPPPSPTPSSSTQSSPTPSSPPLTETPQSYPRATRNMTDISIACEVALRFGVDYSKTAAISTATLVAHNIVTPNNLSQAIDRQKVRRQTQKLINNAKKSDWQEFAHINNIYFDSKKLTIGTRKENLYVFITEPNAKFFCSETNEGEDAESALQMIVDAFTKRELLLSRIYLVGVDGTNVNTGHANGIVRKLEVSSLSFLNK